MFNHTSKVGHKKSAQLHSQALSWMGNPIGNVDKRILIKFQIGSLVHYPHQSSDDVIMLVPQAIHDCRHISE